MNLIEIEKLKKRLKLERYLCFAMTLVMLTNGAHKSDNKDKKSDEGNGITYECLSDYIIPSNLKFETAKAPMMSEEVVVQTLDAVVPLEEVIPIQNEVVQPKELTYEEKMNVIMERDGYTYNELDMVFAGAVAESCDDGNNYQEAYNTMSTIYNRTHDLLFVNDVSAKYGINAGYSVYYQFIYPSQFSVFSNGEYKKYLGRIDLKGYQAAIDMLYSQVPSHNYLCFNNVPPKSGSYERLVSNGNFYRRHQKPEHVISIEKANQLVLSLNKS